jgi:hypothetical protein
MSVTDAVARLAFWLIDNKAYRAIDKWNGLIIR